MFNNILSIKRLKKQLLSINKLIESFFNKLQFKPSKKTQPKFLDNRVAIGVAAIILLFISYSLIPTVYNKDKIKELLKNQVLDQFDVKIQFNDKLKYGLFPKPYFYTKDLSIIYDKEEFVKVDYTKIYISFKNYFSPEDLKIKDLIFKKAEFQNNLNNTNFFKEVLRSKKNQKQILFQDSNLFFEDKNKDALFLLKIKKLNFLYDIKKLNHKMILKGEIFNIPFNLIITDDVENNEAVIKIKSKKIRLNIFNKFNYGKDNINGILDLIFVNKENTFDYKVSQNSIRFISTDENFDGEIDFKPFYFKTNLNFDYLNLKKLFQNNSILINLINSGILNNQNLNGNLDINFKKLNNKYVNDLKVASYLDEGNFIIKNLSFNWHSAASININDIQIVSDFEEIKFIGEIIFNFRDLDKFYRYFQVKKDFRKDLKKIKLDFIYELNSEKITLENLVIDDKLNRDFDKFLRNFNSKEKTIFNKVTFRNLIKDFFNSYDG